MIKNELSTYISVDIETAGPVPSQYALLSIGACRVENDQDGFYVELQPDKPGMTQEAMDIHGLTMEHLKENGLPPAAAMARFRDWLADAVPAPGQPLFVAFNAPFDWMFVNDYFHRYLGENPFGYSAIDMKAFYMGQWGVPWHETNMKRVTSRYGGTQELSHNALEDAVDQAIIFRQMLAEGKR